MKMASFLWAILSVLALSTLGYAQGAAEHAAPAKDHTQKISPDLKAKRTSIATKAPTEKRKRVHAPLRPQSTLKKTKQTAKITNEPDKASEVALNPKAAEEKSCSASTFKKAKEFVANKVKEAVLNPENQAKALMFLTKQFANYICRTYGGVSQEDIDSHWREFQTVDQAYRLYDKR